MSSLRTHEDIGEVLGLHGSGDEMAFEAGRIFSEMDTDSDHHIDIDEFVQFFGTADALKAAAAAAAKLSPKEGDVEAPTAGVPH